ADFSLRLRWPRLTQPMRDLLRLMGPALVSHGAMQINLLVGTILASFLATGAITYLYFSDRIVQLPLGVVGVAVATALLPKLSRALRLDDQAGATDFQNRALEIALLLTLPATAGIMVLATPIVTVVFERGAFSAADTLETAKALVAYAWGLPAFVLVKVLSTPFFAREDTKTPFKITLLTVAANIALAAALMFPLGHVGLAWATTISGWLNVVLLALALRSREEFVLDSRMRRVFPRLCIAVGAMSAVLWFSSTPLQAMLIQLLGGSALSEIVHLALLIGCGGLVFAVVAMGSGAARPRDVKAMLRR
ncbi:MAG: murein biosynthesis integral membrane protein MurJ, partial [Pseudomonadota bacterium]